VSRGWKRTLAVAALAVAGVAAALAGIAQASSKTTNPQPIRKIQVVLTNSGIRVTPPQVVRGTLAQFTVRNAATKPRDFFIAGYIVRSLKPGRNKSFQIQFLFRGRYPYYSAGHPGTRFTGAMHVT